MEEDLRRTGCPPPPALHRPARGAQGGSGDSLTPSNPHRKGDSMARLDRKGLPAPHVEALERREVPSGSGSLPLPTIPQHYSNIRIAELAYQTTPLDSTETQLLQTSVDLVVPWAGNLAAIAAIAPNTPQLVYTNLTNIYGSLLTDWLAYADANGLPRESAFYHVTQATAFTGNSPSSQPVDWFWAVYRGGGNTWTDLTSVAHNGTAGTVAFANYGDSLDIGYTDRYRQFNISLASGASGGWAYTVEYPTAVDSNGKPTAWGTLKPLTDTTGGLTKSGSIYFDPPANWVAASINGSARLFYVRFRTTAAGTAPVATSIRGRDYTQSNDTGTGVIPAFDYAADTDHDGYLNDKEYAVAQAAGMYARFAYEGRLFYNPYGQMRFATDPGNASFAAWAANYEQRYLAGLPLAAGLFVDNSAAFAPAAAGTVIESVSTYSSDYASLLYTVGQAIAPEWLMANVGNAGTSSNEVIATVPAAFEESALLPLAGTYQDFEALAARVVSQEALRSPSPYLVLDSSPAGGSPTDPRTQIATLAEYYQLADPTMTFLDFYGGFSPATSWSQHWSPAAAYNIGQPTGPWSVAATGTDPSNPALTYRIYERSYTNALVLYKPLSYGNGTDGTTGDNTATTFNLGGTYWQLQSTGVLGSAVTSVSLDNGQGAILVKTSPAAAASFSFSGLPTSATAGQSVTFTLTARDLFGNVATGYTGTVHFTSSDGAAVLPADYTFTTTDQGQHTFTVTFNTPGPQILVASDTSDPMISGSAGLTVNPA
jgi:hypothetical protein